MRKLLIAVLAMSTMVCGGFMAPAAAALKGGEGGNGGDFREMQFVSLGYEALDLMSALKKLEALDHSINLNDFAKVLRTVRVKFVPLVKLNEERRSAANFPEENRIVVDQGEWKQRENLPEEKFQLTLHELLPVAGVSDVNYKVSAPIMMKLRERKMLIRLNSGHRKFAQKPVLLYSEYYSSKKTGLDAYEARQLCDETKADYEDSYFFVYCEYLAKSWSEKIKQVGPVTYEVFEHAGKTQVKERTTTWQEYEISEEHEAYGLRVYGWALLGTTPWKVVASSLGLGGGLIDLTFATEREAYRACRERLSKNNSAEFYRAVCRSPKISGQDRYYYEIVTQNPKVK